MRLIDVHAVLALEEGKTVNPGTVILRDFVDDELEDSSSAHLQIPAKHAARATSTNDVPSATNSTQTAAVNYNNSTSTKIRYAILSHCWYKDRDEVRFKEIEELTSDLVRQSLRNRPGYQKILQCCKLASKDRLDWLWVDTCCINKESSAELTEAINSMFRWYDRADRCYTYLHDVNTDHFPTERNMTNHSDQDSHLETQGWPKWFSRGWTLQELIAPDTVLFFNHDWKLIGNKKHLAADLEDITCIPSCVLAYGMDAYRPSIAQIMSWAANRKTKRTEDRAYSLLGLFGVHMPMLYGEGKNAFRRLQLELIRMTNDHSIFAWDRQSAGWSGSVLADDPSAFWDCDDIVKMEPDQYLTALKELNFDEKFSISAESLRTYSVTNAGIQISLPVKRCRGFNSIFEARLACRHSSDSDSLPIGIFLASFKSNSYRVFGKFDPTPGTSIQFQPLYLAYREERRRSTFTFKIDDRAISCGGFVQRCVFPNHVPFKDNSITLSNTEDYAIVVYANEDTDVYFAVAVGYFLGHEWLHIVCDRPRQSNSTAWEAYAEQVYRRIWTASPEHAQSMGQAWQTATAEHHSSVIHLVQHAHLPRSLSGVRIVYKQLPQPQTCLVTIDIARCTGVCAAPGVWQTLDGVGICYYILLQLIFYLTLVVVK